MTGELHPQSEITLLRGTVLVDDAMSFVIDKLNNRVGIPTYESCQNYGEYLRDMGMDFNHEAQRNYAYIEFYTLGAARNFLDYVLEIASVQNPIYHQIANEGTPNAWDLKWRPSTEQFWVWLPTADLPELEKLLSD